MLLKTFVKVGKITNLSDARYCSGMGVNVLGFEVIEKNGDYLPPSTYQEIRGWVSGPSIAVAVYGLTGPDELKKIIDSYQPDYLELSEEELPFAMSHTSLPIILLVTPDSSMAVLRKWKARIAYLQVNENDIAEISTLLNDFPTIVELRSKDNLKELLNSPIKGISLSGSREVRPGFKDYEELASVLEELEE